MKYGMRERISGAIILLALAVIFIPMLFDEPPSREERPEPVLTIEQPIDVERISVDEPAPPASLGQIQPPRSSSQPDEEASRAAEMAENEPEGPGEEQPAQQSEPESSDDPIAELARGAGQGQQAGQRETPPQQTQDTGSQGDSAAAGQQGWAVQVGSYAEAANAERQEQELSSQGFNAFRKSRDNNLTTVYVGPFDTSEAGEEARTQLKDQANIQGLLVRLREDE